MPNVKGKIQQARRLVEGVAVAAAEKFDELREQAAEAAAKLGVAARVMASDTIHNVAHDLESASEEWRRAAPGHVRQAGHHALNHATQEYAAAKAGVDAGPSSEAAKQAAKTQVGWATLKYAASGAAPQAVEALHALADRTYPGEQSTALPEPTEAE